jgi:hypothetical protein
MNRKWILLNLALLALAAWLGWTLRQHWLAAEAKQRAIFDQAAQQTAHQVRFLPPQAITAPQPVMATQYLDVASHMLFASDRNPNVIVEPPKPAPPPPPMPALPSYYGQMSISQPTVLLATVNTPQKSYHTGDKIGPFEIVSFDREKITFKWTDKSVERKLEDLTPKESVPELTQTVAVVQVVPGSQASTPVGSAKSLGGSGNLSGGDRNDNKVGDTISGTDYKTCMTGDTSPPGTVLGDFRKVVNQTLMGKSCYWERISK